MASIKLQTSAVVAQDVNFQPPIGFRWIVQRAHITIVATGAVAAVRVQMYHASVAQGAGVGEAGETLCDTGTVALANGHRKDAEGGVSNTGSLDLTIANAQQIDTPLVYTPWGSQIRVSSRGSINLHLDDGAGGGVPANCNYIFNIDLEEEPE